MGRKSLRGLLGRYDAQGNLLELELRNVRRIANADFNSRELKQAA